MERSLPFSTLLTVFALQSAAGGRDFWVGFDLEKDPDTYEKGARMAKVLVLGGDGYCGWPTSLHLSEVGHEVVIVDNCVRRTIDHELSAASLTPIADLKDRVKAWREVSGQTVGVEFGDLLDWEFVSEVFERHQPDAVVHLQRQVHRPARPWPRATLPRRQFARFAV